MSGIVGIFHRDGAPIEQRLLESLVNFLAFRGPDARRYWTDLSIGLGHTLLGTTDESSREQQPVSFDHRYWITADARLDGRAELLVELASAGNGTSTSISDAKLILLAYAKWGTGCLEHLRGDFSFALWDAHKSQLFCARDQFGVKPFYYASLGSLLVFSNTLDCVRRHPAVSDELNDLAIADFLLFGMIREPAATAFADIHRLPPAHSLLCDSAGVSIRRYWSLPVTVPLRHQRPEECLEQFQELLDYAVGDRLRTNCAGVFMSGGLDSPTVAYSAQRTLKRRGSHSDLCAYTEVFDSLIPHEERHYATLVAEALKMPLEFQVSDEVQLCEPRNSDHRWPEPVHVLGSEGGLALLRQAAAHNRVVLTGFGADPALSCLLTTHFSQLFKERQFARALLEGMRYVLAEHRFSRLYLRTRWRRWFAARPSSSDYPEWLNPDLEKRLGLRERWKRLNESPAPAAAVRPVAYEAMIDAIWPDLFETYDTGVTGVPLEVCHPFFDLRLVDFLLALPALPWCSDKELLRQAARGILPDAVRLRRKSPLPAEPLIAILERRDSAWVDSFEAVPELGRYVERRRVPRIFRERDAWRTWVHLRPLSLNTWLRSQRHCVVE